MLADFIDGARRTYRHHGRQRSASRRIATFHHIAIEGRTANGRRKPKPADNLSRRETPLFFPDQSLEKSDGSPLTKPASIQVPEFARGLVVGGSMVLGALSARATKSRPFWLVRV
jgi:hypothetical protein